MNKIKAFYIYRLKSAFFKVLITILFNNIIIIGVYAQLNTISTGYVSYNQCNDNTKNHQITIYVIPTHIPLDWSSPSGLYTTMIECYLHTLNKPENYLLGHLAFEISSPLLPKPILTGMSSVSSSERIDLVFKDKVGFGILGNTFQGYLESEQEVRNTLEIHKNRNELAFITYQVNEEAMMRMIDFFADFTRKSANNKAPCEFYGGAFWPGFEGEGSGCSALGMALLNAANILPEESEEWLVKLKIPMNLIGGELNNHHEVKFKTIKNSDTWFNGYGLANIDYVPFQIYDPTIIYYWIQKQRNVSSSGYFPVEESGVPGLYVDCRNIKVDKSVPLLAQRTEPSLFIDYYCYKTGMNASDRRVAVK